MVKGLIKNYEVSSAPAPLEGEFAGFYYMGNTGIARFKGNIGSKEVQCLGINDMKHLEEEKNVAA